MDRPPAVKGIAPGAHDVQAYAAAAPAPAQPSLGRDERELALLRDYSAPLPWFVFSFGIALINFMRWLIDVLTPPAAKVTMQSSSFITAAWLMKAGDLGIADMLKDGPLTAAEIADRLGGSSEDVFRGLRLLVGQGYFRVAGPQAGLQTRFANNRFSATLRSDHPNTVRHLVMSWHHTVFPTFTHDALEACVRDGFARGCAFERCHGCDYWEALRRDPGEEAVFTKAMRAADSVLIKPLLADFQWGRFARIVDIGGASGSVMAAILRAHPGTLGLLFDQPQVVERARAQWAAQADLAPLLPRVVMAGGDFFKPETLPRAKTGDLYLLRQILHDWDDASCVAILKSIRHAIGSTPGATLAFAEFALVPEIANTFPHNFRYCLDMIMHHTVRGRERTLAEWRALFAASGFAFVAAHPTRCTMFVIEAVPV